MDSKKEDKKEHILNTAERVFAEYGYEGASTRLLAGEAGVNMAMLNYYFGSKDGLLQAVLERRITSLRVLLEEVQRRPLPAWQRLELMIDIYIDRVLSNNSFHKLVQRELSLSHRFESASYITENIMKNIQVIREVILEGIEDGSFMPVDPEMTVATILGVKYYIVNSGHVTNRLLQTDMQDAQQVEEVVKPRVKKHITAILKAYLIKHEDE
ncbi:TetR/AcrR family transcriptional regulator [Pontibacter actiniarum]|uniref:TetR family transcriptional regulator n=1 Tax=Pontibacter actiniarum TaxID=323450 RepID=A0A1X9YQX3_9BACT|nr:TetR/AcrR family transcriptional regulator [Pontibacter actiniarum]ARS35241.1 TetR family transcriptional regulator [Pontibacter actiniarum]